MEGSQQEAITRAREGSIHQSFFINIKVECAEEDCRKLLGGEREGGSEGWNGTFMLLETRGSVSVE